MISLITLAAFRAGLAESVAKGQSMAFATQSQLAHVFNFRSLRGTVFQRGFHKNRSLLLAVFTAGLLQAAVLFIPFLMAVFRLVVLDAGDWAVVAGLSLAILLLGELWKALRRGVESRRARPGR
jgi:magnesium-transporting ATPase (P-type)